MTHESSLGIGDGDNYFSITNIEHGARALIGNGFNELIVTGSFNNGANITCGDGRNFISYCGMDRTSSFILGNGNNYVKRHDNTYARLVNGVHDKGGLVAVPSSECTFDVAKSETSAELSLRISLLYASMPKSTAHVDMRTTTIQFSNASPIQLNLAFWG